MINEHLLCGTFNELSDHFKNKVQAHGVNEAADEMFVEIPTMPIRVQLEEISAKDEPKSGLLFYFLRNVVNHTDGTFDVNVNLGTEMVWIRDPHSSPYHLHVFNKIIQEQQNTEVISSLKRYATNH